VRIHRLTTSHAPVFLVNSRLALVSAASSSSGREVRHPTEAPLLPKLRGQFAEFLNQSSPDRLSILYLPTCVGLGYGHRASSLEVFLGSVGSLTSPETARHRISELMPDGFAYRTSYMLTPGQPSPGLSYLPASPHCYPSEAGSVRSEEQPLSKPHWVGRGHGGTGISTSCASTTPFGLALAPD
jgi:hypothetical protein